MQWLPDACKVEDLTSRMDADIVHFSVSKIAAMSVTLCKCCFIEYFDLAGYWHQRANERHDNHPQGNQELLVVRDKVGRTPGELGVSKSMEWTLLVGRQEGHPACKKTGCWFVGGDDLTGALPDL